MQWDVEIEEQESWPPDFRGEVVGNRPLILSYQRERARIDRLCEDDILMRINPPANKYRRDHGKLVERPEAQLTVHRLVGYHCTRLTPEEISDIKREGLRLLTPALVGRKLDQCLAGGHLSRPEYDYLTGSASIANNLNNLFGNRAGMIWFCPNRSTLQGYSGVHRLFRSWGGEAVYCGHEKDENIADVLSSIGTPCIVKCAIPFERAVQFSTTFSGRFLSQFIADEIEYPDPGAGFDLYTKEDLTASEVLEIIEYSNPLFEELTRCSGWPEHCRISGIP